jgi:Flp pilus assembly protein TadD
MTTNNTNLLRGTVLVWLALTVAGCASTPNTMSNAAPGTDFSQYSMFGFVAKPATDNANYESLETSYLKVAVSQELDRRGMSYS